MSKTITLPAERVDVALDATYEVDALLAMLKREQALDQDPATFGLVLRSTLARIDALNYVAMGALSPQDERTTEDLVQLVRGGHVGNAELTRQ